jgi:hypothetical protein
MVRLSVDNKSDDGRAQETPGLTDLPELLAFVDEAIEQGAVCCAAGGRCWPTLSVRGIAAQRPQ